MNCHLLFFSGKIHLCFIVLINYIKHQCLEICLCFELESGFAVALAVTVWHPDRLLRQILRLVDRFLRLLLRALRMHNMGKHPFLACTIHNFSIEIMRHGHSNQIIELDRLLAEVTLVFVDVNYVFD